MTRRLDDEVRRSRKLLQNPYAYLDGEGGYAVLSLESAQNVHDARRVLKNQYAYLDERGGYGEWSGQKSEGSKSAPLIDRASFLKGKTRGRGFSKQEIAAIAREVHIAMWHRRSDLFPTRKDVVAADMLDPSAALKGIGFSVSEAESLGQYSGADGLFEVAGVLDYSNLDVQISRRFAPEVRNFTIAHELGHTILHAASGMHRDRALDGSGGGQAREPRETEADLFASYFLLPEKLVRGTFQKRFLTQRFLLNDDTAFALGLKSLDSLRSKCRTQRDLARLLSNAEHFNGVHFHSLARQFRVSAQAMAIRLEELGLIEF